MFSIETKVSWRAAHRLLPPYIGKCNNVHGEYYTATFIFKDKLLNCNDMVADFSEVKSNISFFIGEYLDHSYMYKVGDKIGDMLENGIFGKFKTFSFNHNPTAETIAKFLFYYVKNMFYKSRFKLIKVSIMESTDTNIACYEGE